MEEAAASLNIPVLGKMPLDPKYAKLADEGKFHEIKNPYLADAIQKVEEL